MIKLYEGCWGVTRAGEKKGPFPEKSTLPYCYPFFFENMGWHEDGRRGGLYVDDPNDIIAVFATEAEAEAYLAGEKPAEAPKFPEVGSSFDFLRQDGTWIKVSVVPDAPDPKPVTWPDGVTEIWFSAGRDNITVDGGYISINDGTLSFKPTEARQLAALLKAAADYADEGGK